MDKALEIRRVWEVWSELAYSNNWDLSHEWVVTTWNPYKTPNIQRLAAFTYVCGPDCHQWNSSQKTNPTNKKPTSFSLKHDLFISWNACQLKSCQPDPNPSYSPNLWSSLQKPFPPQATTSSHLISEMGPGLAGTVGDTSEGSPDASGSSWWWLSQVKLLELTPDPHPTVTWRVLASWKSFVF